MVNSPFVFQHGSVADMYVFAAESKNPLDYRDEVRRWAKAGYDISTADSTLAREFMYWAKRYQGNPDNPLFRTMAMSKLHKLRAQAETLPVTCLALPGKPTVRGEVVCTSPGSENVALIFRDTRQHQHMVWFDIVFGMAHPGKSVEGYWEGDDPPFELAI